MGYPADLKYSNEHEWVRLTGDTAEIGVTDYAQQQLGDVVYVDVPDVGKSVSAGAAFGSIESVKAVSELFAPISGEIVEVNAALKDRPELVNKEPHTTWIVRIRPTGDANVSSLLDHEQYERLVAS